jgi:hypothetical protein
LPPDGRWRVAGDRGGNDAAFGVGVGTRRPWWCLDDVDAGGAEYRVEDGGELRVAVAKEVPQIVGSLVEVHE